MFLHCILNTSACTVSTYVCIIWSNILFCLFSSGYTKKHYQLNAFHSTLTHCYDILCIDYQKRLQLSVRDISHVLLTSFNCSRFLLIFIKKSTHVRVKELYIEITPKSTINSKNYSRTCNGVNLKRYYPHLQATLCLSSLPTIVLEKHRARYAMRGFLAVFVLFGSLAVPPLISVGQPSGS